jgi:hypothetical protein
MSIGYYNAHAAENWTDWDYKPYSELEGDYTCDDGRKPGGNWTGFVFQMHLFGWPGRGG